MKKLLLLIALAISVFAGAQTQHWISGWGSAGYSGINYKIPADGFNPGSFAGFGAAIGGGYELNLGKFLLTTGVEGNYMQSAAKAKNTMHHEVEMVDEDNDRLTATFHIEKVRDRYQMGYINIPLMAGYKFTERIYALAGVKYGLNVFGNSKSQAQITPDVKYPQTPDKMFDMASHGLLPADKEYSSPISFAGNLTASVEVGYYLKTSTPVGRQRRPSKLNYRVSLFMDYGLANIHNNKVENSFPRTDMNYPPSVMALSPYITDASKDGDDFGFFPRYKSLMLSERAVNQKFTPLYAGAKFTVLFDVTPFKKAAPVRPTRSRFVAKIYDSQTEEVLAATVVFKNDKDRQVGKMVANRKDGTVARLFSAGNYAYEITMADYEPYSDSFTTSVDMDTVLVQLVHKPYLTVKAINAETKEALVADITVSDEAGKQVFKGNSDATGEIKRVVSKGDYAASAAVQGYITNSVNFSVQSSAMQIIALSPIKIKEKIVLKNLFFDFDKWVIKSESEPTLKDLENMLKENPTMKIHIAGHTDNKGTDTYNERLSRNRAKAVKDEMVKRGIDDKRITYEGKGSKEPLCPANDTEECRAENRRVEFTITKE